MKQVSNKQAIIKRKLRETLEQIDNEREQICQGCGRSDKPLSHSHTISQKRCKEIGKPELIWDKANIEIECFGNENYCHEKWERGTSREKRLMKNYIKKLEYLMRYDQQKHTKLND